MTPTAIPLPGEQVVSACLGWDFVCAVTASGKAFCWGNDNGLDLGGTAGAFDQPSQKAVGAPMKKIACASFVVCAYSDTEVDCWGKNEVGQLGVGDRIDRGAPAKLNLAGAKAVSLTDEHGCAVTFAGEVACWGNPWGGVFANGRGYFTDPQIVAVP